MKTLLCLPSFQQKNAHVQLHHPTVLVSSIPKLGSQREQNGIRGFQCAPDHWRDLFKDLLKSPRISEYLKQSLKITETISKNHSNHLQKSLKITETISKNHSNHLQKCLEILFKWHAIAPSDAPPLRFPVLRPGSQGRRRPGIVKHGKITMVSMVKWFTRPGKRLQFANWKMAIYSWFTHQKWWFSIVMLVCQRVIMMISSSWP